MDNLTTIEELKKLLDELEDRHKELVRARYNLDGPASTLQSKRDKLLRALSRLEHEIGRLKRELITRETQAVMNDQVAALSDGRRAALTEALTVVRRKIADATGLEAILELSRIITNAAASAVDAID